VAKGPREAAVEAPVDEPAELHKGHHAVLVASFLGHDGAVAGEGQGGVELVAGHHQVVGDAVAAVLGVVAADDAVPVGRPGEQRQGLGGGGARQGGGGGGELAPHPGGGLGVGGGAGGGAGGAPHPTGGVGEG